MSSAKSVKEKLLKVAFFSAVMVDKSQNATIPAPPPPPPPLVSPRHMRQWPPVQMSQQQRLARNQVLNEIKALQLRRQSSFKRILHKVPMWGSGKSFTTTHQRFNEEAAQVLSFSMLKYCAEQTILSIICSPTTCLSAYILLDL